MSNINLKHTIFFFSSKSTKFSGTVYRGARLVPSTGGTGWPRRTGRVKHQRYTLKVKVKNMPRTVRQLTDQGYYHIISRGNNAMPLFAIVNGFAMFKSILLESKKKFDWTLHHYCLMPNHVHLLIRIEKGEYLPKLMHWILLGYSRWFHQKTAYTGYLWQGRYKSPLVAKESYRLECGRYIERNPVRANLVPVPQDYPWSSYRHYALGEKDPLIDEDPYYLDFGIDRLERQKKYIEFVSLRGPYDEIVDRSLVGN